MNGVTRLFSQLRVLVVVLIVAAIAFGMTACSKRSSSSGSSGSSSGVSTGVRRSTVNSTSDGEERSYEEVVEQYVNASFEPDMGAIYELYPEEDLEVIKEYIFLYLEQDYDDFIAEQNEETQEYLDVIDENLGEGWTFSHAIIEDKEASNSSLLELELLYRTDGIELDISEFRILTVAVTITSQDGTYDESEFDTVYVMKVDSSWYLVSYTDYDFTS